MNLEQEAWKFYNDHLESQADIPGYEDWASFARQQLEAAYKKGVRDACAMVDEMYGNYNLHHHMQGDCVLAKLSLLSAGNIRQNPVPNQVEARDRQIADELQAVVDGVRNGAWATPLYDYIDRLRGKGE